MSQQQRATYENPLVGRYASKEMSFVWSPQKKFSTWRHLWIALAQAEQELGQDISDEQLAQMREFADTINFDVAEEEERVRRHDVMSHVHAFGVQCPAAKPIIHLGATSCYVTDNTELIQIRAALELTSVSLLKLIRALRDFAVTHRAQATLGFTHYQPAQLTTVGKRACLWLHDFVLDYEELQHLLSQFPFRGVKGTTGTQASFLELFNGDHQAVSTLDRRVTELMGFKRSLPICGQTYTRKIDTMVLNVLAGIASSAHKMATDIRLLMNLKEADEPFAEKQIGSSAMAYKRNPMRSERVCSIARYVMTLPNTAAGTHSTQWFERTLDDSANRRIILPEGFLGTDAILAISTNVASGMRIWPLVIERRIQEELPFMATENIMMACVKAGGDRQELHEVIRLHAVAAANRVKEEGVENDLLDRVRTDSRFAAIHDTLDSMLDPSGFVGRAPEQVDDFVEQVVDPILTNLSDDSSAADLQV